MTVFVDELKKWGPTSAYCFSNGSCHLTATTASELHEFAEKIGMRRGWFQDGRVPHYDLTPLKRADALKLGAVFEPAAEQARKRIRARKVRERRAKR